MDEAMATVAKSPWALLIAIVVLQLLELPVTWILDAINTGDEIPAPDGADQETWKKIAGIQRPSGGAWVGRLERNLFFLSVLFAPGVAVGWLAFKGASKWGAWAHLYKVPETLVEDSAKKLDSLRARMALGSRTYQRFLAGTSANFIAAAISWGLFQILAMGCPRL